MSRSIIILFLNIVYTNHFFGSILVYTLQSATNITNYTNNCFDSLCLNCTNTQEGSCFQCQSSNVLFIGTCIGCFDSNCQECANTSQNGCIRCSQGYSLNSLGSCQQICFDKYCTSCLDQLQNNCVSCSNNVNKYYLVNGECFSEVILGFIIFFSILFVAFVIITIIGCKKGWFTCCIKQEHQQTNLINNQINVQVVHNHNLEHSFRNVHTNHNKNFDESKDKIIKKIINRQHNHFHKKKEISMANNNKITPIIPKIELSTKSLDKQNNPRQSSNMLTLVEIPLEAHNDSNKKGIPAEIDNICVVCNKSKGTVKTKCRCYICTDDKNVIGTAVCHKCKVILELEDENVNEVVNIKEINEILIQKENNIIINCGICLEPNDDLASYHDECHLNVCRDCHYKSMKEKKVCPYCRKQVY